MYTTYHLDSAQDMNVDIINSIKAVFKSKPIKIIITEDDTTDELEESLISVLENRMKDNDDEFISAKQSLTHITQKYGL